jgi:hypothetical protein
MAIFTVPLTFSEFLFFSDGMKNIQRILTASARNNPICWIMGFVETLQGHKKEEVNTMTGGGFTPPCRTPIKIFFRQGFPKAH